MKITEMHLRKLIREELIRGSHRSPLREGTLDIFSEPTMKDGSIDILSKLKYIAAREVGGATPSGAAAVAKGQVTIMPTAAEALDIGWNSSMMGDYLTYLSALAELIPVAGQAVSAAVGAVAVVRSIGQKDWMSTAIGAIGLIPAVGDAIGLFAKALQAGIKSASFAAKLLAKSLGNIAQDKVIGIIRGVFPQIDAAAEASIGAAFEKFKSDIIRAAGVGAERAVARQAGAVARAEPVRRSSRLD